MESTASLEDFLTDSGEIASKKGPARQMATFLAGIVAWVTAAEDWEDAESFPPYDGDVSVHPTNLFCSQRPRSSCQGEILAGSADHGLIVWECPQCGACGDIINWEGSRWDHMEMEDFLGPELLGLAADLPTMERSLRTAQRLLEETGVDDPEEFESILHGFLAGEHDDRLPDMKAEDRAQELIFDAWEAETADGAIALARQAIEIWADCSDAYLILADRDAKTESERFALVQQAFETAARSLDPESLEQEGEGLFWHLIRTRPYMRARLELSGVLFQRGEVDEAVGHWWELLRLNPEDNQGVRFFLSECLLASGLYDELSELLGAFPDETTAAFLYWRALLLFREEGATEEADTALRRAIDSNPHAPDFLLGDEPIPDPLPTIMEAGDEAEAAHLASSTKGPWQSTPGAHQWLHAGSSGLNLVF
jgi:tetratricopeptide (TPR) repeat protein